MQVVDGKKVLVQHATYVGKSLEDAQIIEFHQPKRPDDLALYEFLSQEFIKQSDCFLFLWDSFAVQPSKEFFKVLNFALTTEPLKCGIVLNRVKGIELIVDRFRFRARKCMNSV